MLKKYGQEPPQAIADALIAAVDSFRGSTPISDDQTVVVLRVLP
jgi:serine phosphatase RsbU (regulator of sigma subunit)